VVAFETPEPHQNGFAEQLVLIFKLCYPPAQARHGTAQRPRLSLLVWAHVKCALKLRDAPEDLHVVLVHGA
jgi:hypothetical protein